MSTRIYNPGNGSLVFVIFSFIFHLKIRLKFKIHLKYEKKLHYLRLKETFI